MSEKSILEKALLQVNTLEEAVKENAKGILSSVMKKELKELIKESDDLDEVEDEEETDVTPNEEQEEDIDSTEDENDMGDMDDEEDDMDMDDEDEEDDMDMDDEDEEGDMGDFGMGSDNALDMTGASDSEVLKVFKAMSDEDGIIVKKDGKNLQLKDGDDEYIIRLEESMRKRKSLSEMSFDDDDSDFSDFDTKKHGKSKFSHDDLDKYFDDEDDSDFDMKDKFDMDEMDDDMEFEIDEMDDDMEFEIDEMDDDMEFEIDEMDDDMYDSDLSEGDDKEETVYEIDLDGEDDESEEEIEEASRTKAFGHKGGLKKKMFKAGRKDEINEQVSKLRKQNNEYKKALVLFKDKLNEVAVFNANLAHATRLFTEQSTTKKEKMEILKRFDSVNTITESKRLFNTIKSELDSKTPINESIDRKLKNTPSSSSSKKILSEAKAYESPQYTRMKELMNKMK
jgi:hypothetical protein